MSRVNRESLDFYLSRYYPFVVTADQEDGGFVIEYPDLPGCATQVEEVGEIGPMADEIRTLWVETAYDHDIAIPDPSSPVEYSGKFNVRIPKSLHRSLARAAEREGVSLNQLVVTYLSHGLALGEVEARLDRIERRLGEVQDSQSAKQHALEIGQASEAVEPAAV
jgi:predicted HicB family RNase H-like nuclease